MQFSTQLRPIPFEYFIKVTISLHSFPLRFQIKKIKDSNLAPKSNLKKMAHEIFANTIVLSEGNSFLSSSSEGLYNVLMQSVQAYNGGGFPGLPFFNDTMCGDYAVLSASLPDNMDLCAWRAWLFVSCCCCYCCF